MKKASKILAAVVLTAIVVLTMTACGINGTYRPYSLEGTALGQSISIVFDDLTESEKKEYKNFMDMRMVIEGDTITVTVDGKSESGKFKRDGDEIIPLDADGNPEPMEIEGAKSSFTVNGDKLIMSISLVGIMNFSITFIKE